MRPSLLLLLLLLLMSLLVSGLMPPGDRDWVMDYFSWTLCRKLILGGQMAPKGLKLLLTQTDCRCMCFKRDYMYAVLQHKQWSYSFCWSYTVNHGDALLFQDLRRIMERNQISVLAVPRCYGEGKPVPAFPMNSNMALLLISDTPPTKPVGETSHIALDIIKEGPDSRPSLLVHHRSAASGQKGLTAAITAPLQKILTKRFCVATAVIDSCCPKLGEKLSKMNIRKTSKGEAGAPQIKLKRAMDIKTLIQSNQRGSLRASVSQRDIFHAAAPLSGTSSVKTSEMSRLKTQRHEATLLKKRQHLNSNEDSTWRRTFQKQLSLKAASGVADRGFDATRQREKKGSINRPLSKIRPAQDGNNELFSGKMITKQAELRKAEQNMNTMENRNQMRFAYILQTHSTHKTDIHDFNEKQMLSDVGEEALIMFFLPEAEMETQTDPTYERKLIPNTDIRQRVNVAELGDLPPITKALKDIPTERYASKCKCLTGRKCSLEIYVIDRTERLDVKVAEHEKTVEERVEEPAEKTENPPATDIHDETTGRDQTKHEGNQKTEETVTSSPPPLQTLTTEHTTDTTTVNTKIKDATISTEVINRSSAEKDDGQPSAEESPTTRVSPEPEAHTEPGFMRSKTETTQAKTEKALSGLRMREDVLENITTFLKGTEREGGALTSRTETGRKEDQNDPGVDSFTFSTHHKEPSDRRAKISGDTVPLCRGLIHRTEAGWKHCIERLGGTSGPVDEREAFGANDNNRLNDEENDHFYYFDGVLKRVQNNFYPHYKSERHYGVRTERQKKDTRENLLRYIRRLTSRNRVGDLKRLGAEDDVPRHGR